MGILFSRFRAKESTAEILEKIHDEITLLQEAKANTELSRRKLGLYVIYAWILFIATSVALYFYYAPSTLREKLLSAIPPLFFIFMIFSTKYFFNYIYQWKLGKNDRNMKTLIARKSKILDDVMETETYKVAKEILETYAPETLDKNMSFSILPNSQMGQFKKPLGSPIRPTVKQLAPSSNQYKLPFVIKDSCSEVRRRFVSSPVSENIHPNIGSEQNVGKRTLGVDNVQRSPNSGTTGITASTPVRATHISQSRLYEIPAGNEPPARSNGPPGPPMPRPVLPRERGVFERFVEVLVGDGPSNRYALVCRQCESHNGMALKEEFEYLSYRCVYCYYWNPAKKQRPVPPKIADVPTLTSQLQQALQKNESDGEKTISNQNPQIDSLRTDAASDTEEKKEFDTMTVKKEHNSALEERTSDDESEEPKIE